MARRSGRRGGAGGMIRRMLGLSAFLPVASRAPLYVQLLWALIRDDRTPAARKGLLAVALGYLVVGRDVVPDEVPLLGGLDDLVVVVVAVDLFLDGVPAEVLHEKLDELGIDRASFEQDVAQIRRLTPRPVRRALRRLPDAISMAGRAIRASGLAPRVRGWITREEPIA